MSTAKRKTKKKNSSTLLLFLLFTFIAISTIVVLEYLDYQKGEPSFIFSRLIPLENREKKIRIFNERLITILKNNNIPYDYFEDERKEFHYKMDIEFEHYDKLVAKIKASVTDLKGDIVLAEIQTLNNRSLMLFNVLLGKKKSHILLITRLNPVPAPEPEKVQPHIPQEEPRSKEEKKSVPEEPKEEPEATVSPRLAIIIDDVGAYDIGPLEVKRLQVPITISILPHSSFAADSAYWANEYQLDTLIHLSMQPNNAKNEDGDRKHEITMNSTDEEIRALVRFARQVIPQAKGCNNHQGSLITTSPVMMTRILKILKEEGLFFIDSRTIASTVAYKLAKQMGIPTAQKDIFIDHIQTYDHSMEQLRKLVELARQNGKAIAIGHPFDTTIRAIRDSINYIRAQGVTIVPVKELLN